jgi:hypothetical protein
VPVLARSHPDVGIVGGRLSVGVSPTPVVVKESPVFIALFRF